MALRHLSLKTRDLAVTERFYTERLGLRVAFRHGGMVFLETAGGGDLLEFHRAARRFDPEAGGLDHFGLRVNRRRFSALRKTLAAAEVEMVGRRGRWSVYLKDPNGYTVEVYAD